MTSRQILAICPLIFSLTACGSESGDLASPANLKEDEVCAQVLPIESPKALTGANKGADAPAEWLKTPLSPTELALLRHMSHVTWGTRDNADPWEEWYVNYNSQTGLDAVRYPLAFTAYAAFLGGTRTPAYTQVSGDILLDAIERMLDPLVWDYIEVYWADEPTFPDPVYVENVMYSGHLLQMMVQYQLLTGDDRFATEGFDFVWHDGTTIHYDIHSLAERLFEMMGEYEGAGLPCEPGWVFIYCNNHSALALTLYDRIYDRNYTSAVERWRQTVQKNGPFRVERAPSFFRIVYMDEEAVWVPYGEAGGDAWGLGWMAPWNPDREFLQRGWDSLTSNNRFIETEAGIHLDTSIIMESMAVSSATATSFLPLLARQMEGADSYVAEQTFQWYERLAQWEDTDGDGFLDSLSYVSDEIDRNVVTANVAAGMFTLGDEMMQAVLQNSIDNILAGPRLVVEQVQLVDVLTAYHLENGGLAFSIAPAQGPVNGEVTLRIEGFNNPSVLRDGEVYTQWNEEDGVLILSTTLNKTHQFEVLTQ